MGCSSKLLSLLYFRKDKKMYIACYEELAKKLPGPPTSLILGDAYMNIQEVSSIQHPHTLHKLHIELH